MHPFWLVTLLLLCCTASVTHGQLPDELPPPAPRAEPKPAGKPPRAQPARATSSTGSQAAPTASPQAAKLAQPCAGKLCPQSTAKRRDTATAKPQTSQPAHGGAAAGSDEPSSLLDRMATGLGLSEPVRSKIRGLNEQAKQRALALKAEGDQAKRELAEALDKHMPDHEVIAKHMDRIADLRHQLGTVWAKAQSEASKLLTEQQRERLKRLAQGDLRRPPPEASAPKP
jgi:hypothetical protein